MTSRTPNGSQKLLNLKKNGGFVHKWNIKYVANEINVLDMKHYLE